MKACSIIDAPSDLGLRPTGTSDLPDALRESGLLEGLPDVRYAGSIPVPNYVPVRDATSGVLNPDGIRTFSLRLAERVRFTLDLGRFPVVLGGDCSILLGPALALRRRGRFGLFFIDGHTDFYSPETEPNGEVASMELAIATGRGPMILTDLGGCRPLLRDEDVVVFGSRDDDQAREYGSPDVRSTGMHTLDLTSIRRIGPAEAARKGLAELDTNGVEGIWIHLDADVLDSEIMPAVDYLLPGGMTSDELSETLAEVLGSSLAVGLDITIYNPTYDDDERTAARTLAGAVTVAFARASKMSH